MNRKFLSLLTVICIFTVSLLGQVAYASELTPASTASEVTASSSASWLVHWEAVSGAKFYKISCRDITNSDSGPLLFSNRNVGNVTKYKITGSKLIADHEYRFYVAAYDSAGNFIDDQYKYFTYPG